MARMRISGVILGVLTSMALTGGGTTSAKAQTDFDSCLPMAGIESPDDARVFIARLQKPAASGAREDLANMIAYPLTIYVNGEPVTIYDTPTAISTLSSLRCPSGHQRGKMRISLSEMTAMIGQGEIWFVGWDGPLHIKSINP